MPVLNALFGAGRDLTLWQECARTLLIFGYGLLLLRISGRRTFGKWSALDIVVSIMLGSSLSRALTGSAPLLGTMTASAVLVLLHWLLAQGAARWPNLASVVEGRAIHLVRAGHLYQHARLRHSVSAADLDEALRQKGIGSVGEASTVTLEPSGTITAQKVALN